MNNINIEEIIDLCKKNNQTEHLLLMRFFSYFHEVIENRSRDLVCRTDTINGIMLHSSTSTRSHEQQDHSYRNAPKPACFDSNLQTS